MIRTCTICTIRNRLDGTHCNMSDAPPKVFSVLNGKYKYAALNELIDVSLSSPRVSRSAVLYLQAEVHMTS